MFTFALMVIVGCSFGCSNNKWSKNGADQRIEAPTFRGSVPDEPGKAGALRASQFIFHSDVPINPNSPLIQELSELREQVFRELRLPPSNNLVNIYLFSDRAGYENYMSHHYNGYPLRRAFFVKKKRTAGADPELMVYVYHSEKIRQDLRHEVTHALLHSTLKSVPIWLDEGLAEYYELPDAAHGNNVNHLFELAHQQAGANLPELESLSTVDQMGRLQYQQSWAWVHWMLRGNEKAKNILLSYLREFQDEDFNGQLWPRLKTHVPDALTHFRQHMTLMYQSQTVGR